MSAPARALVIVLALLLAGAASAVAMPGPERPGPDRAGALPPASAPTPPRTGDGPPDATPAQRGAAPTTPAAGRPTRTDEAPARPVQAEDGPALDGRADPPALGRSFVVGVSRGAVLVRLPGAVADQALQRVEDVPVGSIIDARRGAVVLHSALDATGVQQSAVLRGARFEVRQAADGYVDLHLRGPHGTCPPRAGRARAALAAPRRRKHRVLWGQDDHGRFRTHGRDAVATVRGTRWRVQERCDGTEVSVSQGAVDVLDKRTRRTVRVRAGGSYLARRGR